VSKKLSLGWGGGGSSANKQEKLSCYFENIGVGLSFLINLKVVNNQKIYKYKLNIK